MKQIGKERVNQSIQNQNNENYSPNEGKTASLPSPFNLYIKYHKKKVIKEKNTANEIIHSNDEIITTNRIISKVISFNKKKERTSARYISTKAFASTFVEQLRPGLCSNYEGLIYKRKKSNDALRKRIEDDIFQKDEGSEVIVNVDNLEPAEIEGGDLFKNVMCSKKPPKPKGNMNLEISKINTKIFNKKLFVAKKNNDENTSGTNTSSQIRVNQSQRYHHALPNNNHKNSPFHVDTLPSTNRTDTFCKETEANIYKAYTDSFLHHNENLFRYLRQPVFNTKATIFDYKSKTVIPNENENENENEGYYYYNSSNAKNSSNTSKNVINIGQTRNKPEGLSGGGSLMNTYDNSKRDEERDKLNYLNRGNTSVKGKKYRLIYDYEKISKEISANPSYRKEDQKSIRALNNGPPQNNIQVQKHKVLGVSNSYVFQRKCDTEKKAGKSSGVSGYARLFAGIK